MIPPKIIAVIPARAGSKGIPNKNIRLLANKPLVYYAIKNAIQSKNINKVIVSTDSPEVAMIAKRMGVFVKIRDSYLCGDQITLDEVVFDAVYGEDSDYVITMQPTSPTLSVDTLDSAIDYCIRNKYDTVISVINQPHLSWTIDGQNYMPNYKRRLNRQYLPPCYLETGAFFISRRDIISRDSRIGQSVSIFEVPKEESIDVDVFVDLLNAEAIISNQKIGFYVNGNNQIGMGHINRVLELADELYSKPDIYYNKNQTKPETFGITTHNIISIENEQGLFEKLRAKQYNLFINDILSTSQDYMKSLRKILPEAAIVNFEDDGEGALAADLVINALYEFSKMPHVKAGNDYYIAPKKFLFFDPIKIRNEAKKVIISFGGSDPRGYTEKLLGIIRKQKYKNKKFIIVLGKSKKNIHELLTYSRNNIQIVHDVENMPELISNCDIGITSRGRTAYEFALMGIPTISMSQNDREEKHSFVKRENGFIYIGKDPSSFLIESTLDMFLQMSQDDRKEIQNHLLSHDLKNGRKRVIGLFNSLLGEYIL